ncbi:MULTISPECIES: sensor histidine kinase [Microbulbifer]|uniref:sensor histidine kinase n=1 Tax=Microbulbifer TaxID=48073 RepID=UPI001E287BAA|nr:MULTISPECIES: histidine kinase [Microbulbifer]UHQ53748.1 histidine kinase [Microbulbifer sp. YPW16]
MAETPPQQSDLSVRLHSQRWFWKLQLISWLGILVVTFLSLTFWHSSVEWPRFEPGNTLFQCSVAFLLSLLLRPIFDIAWDTPIALRTFLYLVAVAVIAGIWTLVRMEMYIRLTGEHSLWSEFGGWYYASLFVFLFWSALYCGVKYYLLLEHEHEKMLEVAAVHEREQIRRLHAEAVAKEAQLKMLRYQLNPHFLFNTLNSINALIRFEQASEARDMVVRLSQFLRHSLTEDPVQKVTLEQEINAVLLYLEIEKTRFADRLQVELEIPAELNTARVPSMLLQPLAENAVKYAIALSESGGLIKIGARQLDDSRLELRVCDSGSRDDNSGAGAPEQASTGVGLANVRDRLSTLYSNNYSLSQERKENGGMMVRISLPLELAATGAGATTRREVVA